MGQNIKVGITVIKQGFSSFSCHDYYIYYISFRNTQTYVKAIDFMEKVRLNQKFYPHCKLDLGYFGPPNINRKMKDLYPYASSITNLQLEVSGDDEFDQVVFENVDKFDLTFTGDDFTKMAKCLDNFSNVKTLTLGAGDLVSKLYPTIDCRT